MTKFITFSQIINGKIPSTKIYEDEEIFGFRDISPASPEHILLTPKMHIESLNSVEKKHQELLGKILLKAREIAKELGFADAGYRTVINTGKNGGQTVSHLHVHLLGGRILSWPPG